MASEQAWRDYFTVEKVLTINADFNRAMDGWVMDCEKTSQDFKAAYIKCMKRTPRPALTISTNKSRSKIKPLTSITVPKKRELEDKSSTKSNKVKSKKKQKPIPPKEVIPVPKNRSEFRLSSNSSDDSNGCKDVEIHEIDVFIPTLIVTGRPATIMHHAKLTRFVRNWRANNKSLPFLLRNIVVETGEEEQ